MKRYTLKEFQDTYQSIIEGRTTEFGYAQISRNSKEYPDLLHQDNIRLRIMDLIIHTALDTVQKSFCLVNEDWIEEISKEEREFFVKGYLILNSMMIVTRDVDLHYGELDETDGDPFPQLYGEFINEVVPEYDDLYAYFSGHSILEDSGKWLEFPKDYPNLGVIGFPSYYYEN